MWFYALNHKELNDFKGKKDVVFQGKKVSY